MIQHDYEETPTGFPTRQPCRWCGLPHETKCDLVKAMEYHPDGALKRVEFFAPNDYRPLSALGPLAGAGPMPNPGTVAEILAGPPRAVTGGTIKQDGPELMIWSAPPLA